MCLLIVVSRVDPEAPLVVAANRDERVDRPAVPMTVLREHGPRILGGLDEEAGGTWLAVNEHGVAAGLTNRPSPEGRDPSKRTRGELPIMLAGHADAREAAGDFVERINPGDFNPAWLLVGDRRTLYALDLSLGDRPVARSLGPGVHILENNPIDPPSPKVDHVRALLGDIGALRGRQLVARLRSVLADHTTPSGPADTARRPESLAACVHTPDYGTRSSTVVRVPVSETSPPEVLYTGGHPCTAPFVEATSLWGA
jgi:uncharacterized protein with NRDE domain